MASALASVRTHEELERHCVEVARADQRRAAQARARGDLEAAIAAEREASIAWGCANKHALRAAAARLAG